VPEQRPPEPPKLDFSGAGDDPIEVAKTTPPSVSPPEKPLPEKPYNLDRAREETRGDLARGLLWLLAFTVAGVLVFVALGRVDGSAITQSIFPSLVALAGTALGFYFGSQVNSPGGAASGAAGKPPADPGSSAN
jgi:hypothetical protein